MVLNFSNSMSDYKNQTITDEEQELTSRYSDSSVSFLYNNNDDDNDNDNKTSNNKHKSTLYDLDLAHGLVDLLIKNGFTLQSLLNASPFEVSNILGIDQEIAAIICAAANKKREKNKKAKN